MPQTCPLAPPQFVIFLRNIVQQLSTYFGPYLKNYSHDFTEILGSCSKQYKGNEFALTKKHDRHIAVCRWAIPLKI